jgi:hypothetical protein
MPFATLESGLDRGSPMSGHHDWPLERPAKGSLRPWFFSAMGYIMVLFGDGEEAQRAQRGLVQQGIPEEDIRLYGSQASLDILSRLRNERSPLAKAIAALTIDRVARSRYMENAKAGGAALWLYAETDQDADRLIRLLADYDYETVRYYGDQGVTTIEGDSD